MILVDTSIWVDHLRSHSADLVQLLEADAACTHPYVIGEIALGHLRQRKLVMKSLHALPAVAVATPGEILTFVENRTLFGRGLGYVDICLLAATVMAPHTWLWTSDKQLKLAASDLGLAASPPFAPTMFG